MVFHGRWRRRHRHQGWYGRRWGRWGPRWNGPGRLRGRRLRQRLEHRLPRHSLSGECEWGSRVGHRRGHRRSRRWRSRMRWLHSRRGRWHRRGWSRLGRRHRGRWHHRGSRRILGCRGPSSNARCRRPCRSGLGLGPRGRWRQGRRTHWLLGLGLSLSIGRHRRRICPRGLPAFPLPARFAGSRGCRRCLLLPERLQLLPPGSPQVVFLRRHDGLRRASSPALTC